MRGFDGQVLILGGGISGCVCACLLADQGIAVTIVEERLDVMDGASRWNEGKLHLGYIYSGTPSLSTARLMQRGTGVFEEIIERVTGRPLEDVHYTQPVTYLVDDASMVGPEVLWERARAIAASLEETVQQVPGLKRHLGDGPLLERIHPDVAAATTGQGGIAAAWRTTERAVSARVLSERLREAVKARDIDVVHGTVCRVEPVVRGWRALLEDGCGLQAPVVVNCLWQNRVRMDRLVARLDEPVSIRYRRHLFGQGLSRFRAVAPTSRVLGRFGDVAPYGNGDVCLTWYMDGMVARSDDGHPPIVPDSNEMDAQLAEVMQAHLAGLGLTADLVESLEHWQVRGGYVVAHGHGDIDRMDSPLHERSRPDARELRPGYVTVDTGKLCLGPLMASRAATLALMGITERRDS